MVTAQCLGFEISARAEYTRNDDKCMVSYRVIAPTGQTHEGYTLLSSPTISTPQAIITLLIIACRRMGESDEIQAMLGDFEGSEDDHLVEAIPNDDGSTDYIVNTAADDDSGHTYTLEITIKDGAPTQERAISAPGFCTLCEAEAVYVVRSPGAAEGEPLRLCSDHKEAFEMGQANPESQIIYAPNDRDE